MLTMILLPLLAVAAVVAASGFTLYTLNRRAVLTPVRISTPAQERERLQKAHLQDRLHNRMQERLYKRQVH
ncbi:MAG: hypothetical protein AAF993_02790 [Pseudomonadota bacterium]